MAPATSERSVILLIAAVQFVNILEFMMVMPLGPDFAKDLDIAVSHLGLLGGSYTASAALFGLISATFIEKFDRRKALATVMTGLVLATLCGAAATNLTTMMLARVMAGMFGGPATSLSLAIVADIIPAERRGKAMSVVMMAFSLASVLGVPIGLALAQMGTWRTTFFAVAGLALLVAGFSLAKLPKMTRHMERAADNLQRGIQGSSLWQMIKRPEVMASLAMVSLTMAGMFLIIPNLSAYVQGNLGLPRSQLGSLYLVGGLASFIIMRPIGIITDKFGPFKVGTAGTISMVGVLYFGFIHVPVALPVMALFVLFMCSANMRNIPFNTLTSKVPHPDERARYMSIQSAVQHFSAATGAFLSSKILTETPTHQLVGMSRLAWLALLFTVSMPFFLFFIELKVDHGEAIVGMPKPLSRMP